MERRRPCIEGFRLLRLSRAVDRQPAYVLHRRRYGESSLLLEVYCQHHGRIGLIAKGAAGSRSGRAALLQPFSLLELSWRGRGELPTLTTADRLGHALMPRGNHLAACFYINELILKLCQRGDGSPALFESYGSALIRSGADLVAGLRSFELDLLEELGYGLDFSLARSGQWLCLQPEQQPSLVERPERPSPFVVSAETALALAARELSEPRVRDAATRLLRATLAHYLGGVKLRSRELFRSHEQT